MQQDFQIHGVTIRPGEQQTINIPLSRLADHTRMNLTALVIHGKKSGPVTFVSAAIHGDEIIGVEIIRRISELKILRRLRGTLILVPIVNAYGFNNQSRYLPDRRDLNRSFPGSESGSLASQLAFAFMSEIVASSQYGLDLHSGAVHRENLPQIRADLEDPDVLALAEAFGASIMLNANLRDGSLRAAAKDVGCKILLYEAGEALRFDEVSVRVGVKGVIGVMRHIGMLPALSASKGKRLPSRSDSSHWVRAPIGGIMRAQKKMGDRVKRGETIALISGPLGSDEEPVLARSSGIIIGRTNLPIVSRGDGLFHVARVASLADTEEVMEELGLEMDGDPLFDGMTIA
ncbi:MAG: succinylglutamate desuccinylase/aspartoacylase family protein [Oceanococcus sp.]